MVGNKLDQEENRQVSFIEASRWAKEHDLLYVETSSMTGESVDQPFILLARSVLLAIESGRLDPEKVGSGVSYGERVRLVYSMRAFVCGTALISSNRVSGAFPRSAARRAPTDVANGLAAELKTLPRILSSRTRLPRACILRSTVISPVRRPTVSRSAIIGRLISFARSNFSWTTD